MDEDKFNHEIKKIIRKEREHIKEFSRNLEDKFKSELYKFLYINKIEIIDINYIELYNPIDFHITVSYTATANRMDDLIEVEYG